MIDNNNFNNIWNQTCKTSYQDTFNNVKKIICIGDLHSDINLLLTCLQLSKIIDSNYKWIAGNTYVVQLGDQIDGLRITSNNKEDKHNENHGEIKILLYLSFLDIEARKYNGRVISLLGNHELMNVEGIFNYVSNDGFTEFYNFFKDKYPGNKKELREYLFKPGNLISNFLGCTRYVLIKINNILFVHGGILKEIADKYNISDINKIMMLYLFDKLSETEYNMYNDIYDMVNSPLFTRKYFKEDYCSILINNVFKKYNAKLIVVGHTPILDEKNIFKCNKKILFTDYGGSFAFKIKNKKIRIFEINFDDTYNNYEIFLIKK